MKQNKNTGLKRIVVIALYCILFVLVCGVILKIGKKAMSLYFTEDTRSVALPLGSLSPEQRVKMGLFQGLYKEIGLTVGKAKFDVQIADTQEIQELGLSFRTDLESNKGMLFVFQKDDYYPFWMKDMNFPLDIVWINSGKKIVHIEHGLSPDTYPQTCQSGDLARYVLELPPGTTQEYNIKIGDQVSF